MAYRYVSYDNCNKEDFEKAMIVITKCVQFVQDELGKYCKEKNFPKRTKLYELEIINYTNFRGRTKVYLTIGFYGLETFEEWSNGCFSEREISTKIDDDSARYSYNAEPQKCIEFALVLAKHWSYIKEQILKLKEKYLNECVSNSQILSDFQV